MTGEDSLTNIIGDEKEEALGGVPADQEIERLRRQLHNLERSKETISAMSSSTGSIHTGSSSNHSKPRRRRSSYRKSFAEGSFPHLSRSTRNLGVRTPYSDSMMASRSMSITSNVNSVDGIFGDSDDDLSPSSSSDDLERIQQRMSIRRASQYTAMSQSFAGGLDEEERFTRLKRSDDLQARRGSDDDMNPISSTDDDDDAIPGMRRWPMRSQRQQSFRNHRSISMQPQVAHDDDDDDDDKKDQHSMDHNLITDDDVVTPNTRRGLLRNRRQESYRNIRAISMVAQLAREDGDDYEDDEKGDNFEVDDERFEVYPERMNSKSEVYADPQAVARMQRYLWEGSQGSHSGSGARNDHNSDADSDADASQIADIPTHERIADDDVSEGEASIPPPPRERMQASPGSSRKNRSQGKISAIPGRRNSYCSVMPLSIAPGGKASIMESSHNRLDYYSSDSDGDNDAFANFAMMQCAPSFSQFALLHIQPEQLLLVENEYLFADHGPAHLDAFLLNQEMEFGDHFTANAGRPIDPAAVGSFCFPDGLRVRYLPKAGMIGAKRMGWIGPKGDKCHIMVFTSGYGITEHGVAITIQWEMSLKKNEKMALSEAVYKRRKRRRAARKIQTWWRRQEQDRVLKEALEISGFPNHSPSDLKAELTSDEIKLLEKALKSTSDRQLVRRSTSKSPAGRAARKQLKKRGINKKLNAVLSKKRGKSPVGSDTSAVEKLTRAAVLRSPSSALLGGFDTDSRESISDFSSDEELINTGPSAKFSFPKSVSARTSGRFSMRSMYSARSTVSTNHSPQPRPRRKLVRRPSKRVIELAQESYDTMKENDRLGSVCVVEKCYTLIGCQPDEHTLLIGPLQQLIDSERNEVLALRRARNELNQRKRPKDKTTTDVDEERRLEWELKNRRHIIIRAMREKLRLTTRQALVTYPRSQLEYVQGKINYFETLIPQIPDSDAIKLPLPLPRIGKEWALAQFLLDIGPDALVICLKLMLLERSILILGDNLQHVSTYACALIELLKPFEWSNAFMPVLPRRMLDFVNCPVPFIAGVAVRNVSEVENDSRVLEAMSNGMSVLNVKTNTLQITTEKGMSRMISLDPYLRDQLKSLRSRLQHMAQGKPQSSLRNFSSFYKFGLSRRESVTLRSVCQVLEAHFTNFCGDLAVNDKAWKRYGTIDVETNEFVFNYEWFLNPIRADQAFHEQMVQTQLFSGYVHERREEQMEMQEIMEGDLGYLIAEWLYDKWMSRRAKIRGTQRRW